MSTPPIQNNIISNFSMNIKINFQNTFLKIGQKQLHQQKQLHLVLCMASMIFLFVYIYSCVAPLYMTKTSVVQYTINTSTMISVRCLQFHLLLNVCTTFAFLTDKQSFADFCSLHFCGYKQMIFFVRSCVISLPCGSITDSMKLQ